MSQVVIITGMHRSGTSMVARLLSLCGVYLGPQNDLLRPQPDNLEGYWENQEFVLSNEELLAELGGGWDYPPPMDLGWEKSNRFLHLKSKASQLVQQFSKHEYWGWKDPRNCITLPFWRELIPSVKVIICVRNPLEVADSLSRRNNHSRALAFNLWYEYNQSIMVHSQSENRIITHYDAYFLEPIRELTRILTFLGLDIPERDFREFLNTVDVRLRHNQATPFDLVSNAPEKVSYLYRELCDQTVENVPFSSELDHALQIPVDKNNQSEDVAERSSRLLSASLQSVAQIIAERDRYIELLKAQVSFREDELAEIYRSKAWRFVQSFRRTRQKILG